MAAPEVATASERDTYTAKIFPLLHSIVVEAFEKAGHSEKHDKLSSVLKALQKRIEVDVQRSRLTSEAKLSEIAEKLVEVYVESSARPTSARPVVRLIPGAEARDAAMKWKDRPHFSKQEIQEHRRRADQFIIFCRSLLDMSEEEFAEAKTRLQWCDASPRRRSLEGRGLPASNIPWGEQKLFFDAVCSGADPDRIFDRAEEEMPQIHKMLADSKKKGMAPGKVVFDFAVDIARFLPRLLLLPLLALSAGILVAGEALAAGLRLLRGQPSSTAPGTGLAAVEASVILGATIGLGALFWQGGGESGRHLRPRHSESTIWSRVSSTWDSHSGTFGLPSDALDAASAGRRTVHVDDKTDLVKLARENLDLLAGHSGEYGLVLRWPPDSEAYLVPWSLSLSPGTDAGCLYPGGVSQPGGAYRPGWQAPQPATGCNHVLRLLGPRNEAWFTTSFSKERPVQVGVFLNGPAKGPIMQGKIAMIYPKYLAADTSPITFDDLGARYIDSDGDKLPDIIEGFAGTDPNAMDTDGDGLGDGLEVGGAITDPIKSDTDTDKMSDLEEVAYGSNPRAIELYLKGQRNRVAGCPEFTPIYAQFASNWDVFPHYSNTPFHDLDSPIFYSLAVPMQSVPGTSAATTAPAFGRWSKLSGHVVAFLPADYLQAIIEGKPKYGLGNFFAPTEDEMTGFSDRDNPVLPGPDDTDEGPAYPVAVYVHRGGPTVQHKVELITDPATHDGYLRAGWRAQAVVGFAWRPECPKVGSRQDE